MYKLEDYIIAARAIQVIETAYETDMSISTGYQKSEMMYNLKNILFDGYFGITDPMYYVNMQNVLSNIFEFLFPGSTLDKYVSIRKFGTKDKPYLHQIPIFVLTLLEHNLKLPLYITSEYVLFISPFGNSELKEKANNYYIYPLFRTSILADPKSFCDQINMKNIGESIINALIPTVYKVADYDNNFGSLLKSTLLDICGFPIKRQIELITNLSDGRSYYDQEIISTESKTYEELMNRYAVEAVADSEYDTLITPTDYLPIVLEHPTNNSISRLGYLISKSAKSFTDYTRDIEIEFLNKENKPQVATQDSRKVLLRSNQTQRQLVYLTSGLYMIPKNNIAVLAENDQLKGTIKIDELYSDLPEDTHYTIGTESFINDAVASLKIGGIKLTQSMKEIIKLLMKFPIKIAKYIFKDVKNFFKRFDKELEKADSLEYREKVLNDELDQVKDMLAKWSRVIVFSTLTFAIFGNVLFLFFGLIFWRIDDNNSRVRSINRQIKVFNDAIVRIDQKIDFARQEGRYPDVDALLKEKQMLTLGRRELLQLKKRNYAAADKANKEKYGDYDEINDAEKSQSNNYYNW